MRFLYALNYPSAPSLGSARLSYCALVAALMLTTFGGVVSAQAVPGEIVAALRSGHVYVAPGARLRLTPEEQADLERFADQRQLDGRAPKFVVLDRVPQGFRSLGHLVESAHSTLDLGDGVLIAVVLDTGRGSGSVSAKTDALDADSVQRLQRQALGTFAGVGFAEGFKLLTTSMIGEVEAQRTATATAAVLLALLLVLVAAAVVTVVLIRASNRWKRELAATQETADSLSPLIRRLDDELPLVEDEAQRKHVDEPFSQGTAHYDRATSILGRLRQLSAIRAALPGPHRADGAEASRQLGMARFYLSDATDRLERATGAIPQEPEIRLLEDEPSVT